MIKYQKDGTELWINTKNIAYLECLSFNDTYILRIHYTGDCTLNLWYTEAEERDAICAKINLEVDAEKI